jgi:hypothetical protein
LSAPTSRVDEIAVAVDYSLLDEDTVRVAILSDSHFGDDLSTLVVEPPKGPPQLGPAYPALARAVGRADYVVLLGDVLDFSVASFEKAYRHAKVFFTALQASGRCRV